MISTILFIFAVYISFINMQENYLNILMVYSFISALLLPFVFLAYCFMKGDELNAFTKGNYRIFINALWLTVWLRMILLDYLWTGALGIVCVIGCHTIIIAAKNEIEKGK